MAVPLLTPVRTVLLIGDEALYIYKVNHNQAKLVDGVPWQTEGFNDTVVDLIRKECGGKPILILNDMTDQHFKGGQRMPKVSIMDQGNVLKRKLQVAFPNYPIRGALPIKDKGGRKNKSVSAKTADVKQGGGLYLFAAVPVSEPVVKTLEAAKLSMASISAFALLPVESSDMVRKMSEKLAAKNRGPSKWVVFMGQHQSGALRQVITRDGQLAMTRMTPVVDSDADPQAWVHEVSQEFKATISYLSRFGFTPEDGTDVIVVAGKESGEALEKLIDIPCNYHSFTVQEAARLLDMKIGMQDEMRYADPLHVAWIGRKTKFILPMESTEISRVHKPRQAVAAALFLLVLGGGYLGWQLTTQAQEMMATKDVLESQRAVLAQAEVEYQEEVKRMEALGFDIDLIQGAIKTYESFETGSLDPLPFLKKVGDALGNDLRLDNLAVSQIAGGNVVQVNGLPQVEKAKLEATLSLSFPPTVELDYGIQEIRNLERRLRSALPDYEVIVTRQVARPEYDVNIRGEAAGRTAQQLAEEEDYNAELVIRGPI